MKSLIIGISFEKSFLCHKMKLFICDYAIGAI